MKYMDRLSFCGNSISTFITTQWACFCRHVLFFIGGKLKGYLFLVNYVAFSIIPSNGYITHSQFLRFSPVALPFNTSIRKCRENSFCIQLVSSECVEHLDS